MWQKRNRINLSTIQKRNARFIKQRLNWLMQSARQSKPAGVAAIKCLRRVNYVSGRAHKPSFTAVSPRRLRVLSRAVAE
jgi:hypothetical protein